MTTSPTDDLASAECRNQELAKELSQARGELAESREQRVATAAILAAIPNSATDPSGVFAEIAASAARLCDAYDATIFQVDGGFLRIVAHHGPIPSLPVGDNSLPLMRGVATARAVLDHRTIHVADLQTETAEYPASSDRARRLGFRTIIAVPLIRAEVAIGAVTLRRTEAKLFSDKQIALLESFANQAVIAIENTRLFEAEQASKRELEESLEYQTATSEVLGVISRSTFELQPVLDAIASTAKDLCNAYDAALLQRFGDHLSVVSHRGPLLLAGGRPMDRSTVTGRALLDKRTIHVHDYLEVAEQFPLGAELARKHGGRTALAIPLALKTEAIGCLFIRRIEV